jgi:hypothetical protein
MNLSLLRLLGLVFFSLFNLGFCDDVIESEESILRKEYYAYLLNHNKPINRLYDEKRFQKFISTYNLIDQHNKKHSEKKENFKLSLNHFADLSDEEVQRYFSSIPTTEKQPKSSKKHVRGSFSSSSRSNSRVSSFSSFSNNLFSFFSSSPSIVSSSSSPVLPTSSLLTSISSFFTSSFSTLSSYIEHPWDHWFRRKTQDDETKVINNDDITDDNRRKTRSRRGRRYDRTGENTVVEQGGSVINDDYLNWATTENRYGVRRNIAEAIKLYQLSAEKNYAAAQNNLGFCYFNGIGVAKNLNAATFWYKKAAEQDYAAAQYNLGYCYEKGYGVTSKLHEVLKWYRLAASNGNEKAIKALVRFDNR